MESESELESNVPESSHHWFRMNPGKKNTSCGQGMMLMSLGHWFRDRLAWSGQHLKPGGLQLVMTLGFTQMLLLHDTSQYFTPVFPWSAQILTQWYLTDSWSNEGWEQELYMGCTLNLFGAAWPSQINSEVGMTVYYNFSNCNFHPDTRVISNVTKWEV